MSGTQTDGRGLNDCHWCVFNSGPIDGDHIPIAPHCQTPEVVIYQSGGEPGYAGRMLDRPAVYVRADGQYGTHRWKGADGLERTGLTQVYAFDRCVSRAEANVIESKRWQDIDAERADGGSL